KVGGRVHVDENGKAQPGKIGDAVMDAAEPDRVAGRDKIAVHRQADGFEPRLAKLFQRRSGGSNPCLAIEPSRKIEAARWNAARGRRGGGREGEGGKHSPAGQRERL